MATKDETPMVRYTNHPCGCYQTDIGRGFCREHDDSTTAPPSGPLMESPPQEQERGGLPAPTFARFMEEVRATMEGKAVEKGYSDRGVDGPNQLLDFTEENFPGHSLGEVVYKAIRYQRKGDPEDLVKIAAWTFLRWRRHQERG